MSRLLAPRTINKLDSIKQILEEYKEQDLLPITIRQLYYELVSRSLIDNDIHEYRKVAKLMTYARDKSIIPYDHITDSTREVKTVSQFKDLKELRQAAIDSYKKKRWEDQEYYLEVWVEKDAIASTIEDIPRKYCIPFMSNRGYSSTTAMWDAMKRFFKNNSKMCKILYLGDHDPSGLHMDEDIYNRVWMPEDDSDHEVERIALTMEQIKKYNLPSNPAKEEDPRAWFYIEEHGNKSWELEALPIKIVRELLENKIKEYIDFDKYNRVLEHEKQDIERFKKITEVIEN